MRGPARILLLFVLIASTGFMLSSSATGLTSATITINGDFSDWSGVLADSGNSKNDPIGDVSNSNYDFSVFAFTYNPTYIYFYFKRQVFVGGATTTFDVFMDLNYNKRMDATDKVLRFKSNSSVRDLCSYAPDDAVNGDPMNGDNNTIDPTNAYGCATSASALISGNPDNTLYETQFPCATIGIDCTDIPAMWFHVQADGGSWIDSPNELESGFAMISLVSSQSAGGTKGTYVDYVHTLINQGNRNEVFPVTLSGTRAGWTSQIVGCPAPCTIALPEYDPSNPGASTTTFTVRVNIPMSASDGTVDHTTVTVTSANYPDVAASNTDTTTAGAIVITPNYTKYGTPLVGGMWVVFDHTIYNYLGSADTVSLTAVSALGWTTVIRNSADTADIASIAVPAGGSNTFKVKVFVPDTAIPGQLDTTTVQGVSGNIPGNKARATDEIVVTSALSVAPNNTGIGGRSTTVLYNHTVRNSTASDLSVTVSSASSLGWTRRIYESDGVTLISAPFTLPAFGGTKDIIVQIDIPAGAAVGATDVTTVTATSGGYTGSGTDSTTVRVIILYRDAARTQENYTFPATYTVYALATGLQTSKDYVVTWTNSSGAAVGGSPYTITSNASGQIQDQLTIPAGGPNGTWTMTVTRSGITVDAAFFVGPDHIEAVYTGGDKYVGELAEVMLYLRDIFGNTPLDPTDPANVLVVCGDQTITVTLESPTSSVYNASTLAGYSISGRTITGNLVNGQASVTITDTVAETVTVTPNATTILGSGASPDRDVSAEVVFHMLPTEAEAVRILDWREVFD